MSQRKKIATHESYGKTFMEPEKEYEDLLVLDADLVGPTRTAVFRKAFPERHINYGIIEQDMIGVVAGIAATGHIAFAGSPAIFATGGAYEQIRNSVGHPQFNMKVAATHDGILVGKDGATHQCNENFALMRTIPGMVVIVSSDDAEAEAMVRTAYVHRGSVYMRFSRFTMPVFNNSEAYQFEIGKAITMREGKNVAIIAAGPPVVSAMEAAEKLMVGDIEARVIDMHTIKPFNEEAVLRVAREIGRIVTAEEHSVIGDPGSAVVEVLAEQRPAKLKHVGVYNRYTESSPAKALIRHYGLDGEGVYNAIKAFLA